MRDTTSKLTIFLGSLIICIGQVVGQNKQKLAFDTSTTTIIAFKNIGNWSIFNRYKATTLTQSDLTLIQTLLQKAINDYNDSRDSLHAGQRIDLTTHHYKKQIIAATNSKGEKEVWINFLCKTEDFPWKTTVMEVDDGGSCFFNLKINLTLKKTYDFAVNGDA